jgi:hypothetical protein
MINNIKTIVYHQPLEVINQTTVVKLSEIF